MKKVPTQITVEEARKKAELAVMRDINHYASKKIESALEKRSLEAEYCWIFFRNKSISVMPEHWFTYSYDAFAISKKGDFSQVSTLGFSEEQLESYLKTMSDYFGKKQ